MNKICDSINKILNTDVILMGDFNARDIDWETGSAVCESSKILLDTLEDNLLTPLVKEPTHGTNILVLVLVGNIDIVDCA